MQCTELATVCDQHSADKRAPNPNRLPKRTHGKNEYDMDVRINPYLTGLQKRQGTVESHCTYIRGFLHSLKDFFYKDRQNKSAFNYVMIAANLEMEN